ncbi:DUF6090 family protein [Mangrovimonas sp. YM274]|uniref:DUF6090 family protein n=1 Tax=Mangrovimonas sp. YM274 TaxID=3070660 RepID=UPI0027DBC648|nr:DUF6090 family protein [Mangrovimonas sp. YM274]WMI67776.1 DUF6090 family protein [Mangrovimonas sp. YM274]
MIKFFRKTRYNLMLQNNTTKYLKYAIGEIILVVIGILIALSINNWNQNRIERKKEKQIIKELVVDLEDQSKVLATYIEVESSFYQNGRDLLKYFSANQTFYGADSIYGKLNSLASRQTFNPINTTFQELIATGTIGILKDETTKRKIIQYYNELKRISLVIGNNNIHIVDAIYQQELLKQTTFILDEDDSDLKTINDAIFNEKSLGRIRQISKNELSTDSNMLHLFNLLEQRTIVAMSHMELYKTVQKNTEQLLSDIKTPMD